MYATRGTLLEEMDSDGESTGFCRNTDLTTPLE